MNSDDYNNYRGSICDSLTNEHELSNFYDGCPVCCMGSGDIGTQKGTSGGVSEPLDEKTDTGIQFFLLLYDSVSVFHLCHSGNEYNI